MAFFMEKQKTTSTPYLLIDEEKSYMFMEGRCFHENTADFFSEVNLWLDSFLYSDFENFTFDCAMNYINSSAIKIIFNMLMKMESAANGKPKDKIIINWIAAKDNEIILECGEDFKEDMSNVTFNIVVK